MGCNFFVHLLERNPLHDLNRSRSAPKNPNHGGSYWKLSRSCVRVSELLFDIMLHPEIKYQGAEVLLRQKTKGEEKPLGC